MVIDKQLITEKITRAGELPAYSLTPPGTGTGYQPPPGLPYDPERARQLARGGRLSRRARLSASVYYLYKGDSDLDRDIAVELQGMFARELGIKMQLQAQEWTAYLDTQSRLEYDLCRSSWVADYNDPNTFLNMFVTNDGNNRTGWSNARYDALIAAAAQRGGPREALRHFPAGGENPRRRRRADLPALLLRGHPVLRCAAAGRHRAQPAR